MAPWISGRSKGASISQNHDSVRRWRQSPAEVGEHPAGVQREAGPQFLAVDFENFAVVLCVSHEQDEAIKVGVALLQCQPSLQSLEIGQVRLGLDPDDAIEGCLGIYGSKITGYRQRHLGRPPSPSGQPAPKPRQEPSVRRVSDGISTRVEANRQLQSDCRSRAAKLVDRDVMPEPALDASERGMAHSGGGSGNPQAEACSPSSSADLCAGYSDQPTSFGVGTIPGALARRHGMTLRRMAYR